MKPLPASRGAIAVLLATATLLATGCAPASAPSPSPSPSASFAAVCADARVVACQVDEASMILTVGAEVSDTDTVDLLRTAFAATETLDPSYSAQLVRAAVDAPSLDSEVATLPRWTLAFSPGSLDEAEFTLARMLEVEKSPGTLAISEDGSWPSVTIADIDQFAAAFAAVSALPMFADGGTYTLLSLTERLRIVHTPRWVTTALIDDVTAISRAYPDAEVLLEAPKGGAQPPALFIARLTPDEVTAVGARLAALGGVAMEGIGISYTLGSLGTDGVTYTNGVIGDPVGDRKSVV